MFGSIVFDFGVIVLNFAGGEGRGQGARAPMRGPLSHQFFGARGLLSHQKLEWHFFFNEPICSVNVM